MHWKCVCCLPGMVSFKNIFVPFCGTLKRRISPWWLPKRERLWKIQISAETLTNTEKILTNTSNTSRINWSFWREKKTFNQENEKSSSVTCSIRRRLIQHMHMKICCSIRFVNLHEKKTKRMSISNSLLFLTWILFVQANTNKLRTGKLTNSA